MKGSLSHWWAVLLDAELQSEIENARHDGKAALRNLRVAGRIRTKLRDEYGLNLDSIGEKARTEYLRLYQEEILRDEKEAEKERALDAVLAEARAALQRGEGSG